MKAFPPFRGRVPRRWKKRYKKQGIWDDIQRAYSPEFVQARKAEEARIVAEGFEWTGFLFGGVKVTVV